MRVTPRAYLGREGREGGREGGRGGRVSDFSDGKMVYFFFLSLSLFLPEIGEHALGEGEEGQQIPQDAA